MRIMSNLLQAASLIHWEIHSARLPAFKMELNVCHCLFHTSLFISQMEKVLCSRLIRISLTKWRSMFAEFQLPPADSSELLRYGPLWLRLGRLWGAFRWKLDLSRE